MLENDFELLYVSLVSSHFSKLIMHV